MTETGVEWRQYSFEYRDLAVAVQECGPESGRPILALHGWQDNSASFARLAELLPEYRWIAPDFPGHGRSDWRDEQASYYLWSYLEELHALILERCDGELILLGHSMGGAVASLYAALYPQRADRLVMLDMLGPIVTAPEQAPAQMLQALEQQRTRRPQTRRYYSSFEAAVEARANKGLAPAAARALAERGVVGDAQGWYWRQDARLHLRNMLSMSEEQAAAFMRRVLCPTLLVAAPPYWRDRPDWYRQRQGYFARLESHMLDGGHHQHMEAEAPRVAALIRAFLESDPA